jgi:hypothetical protein
MSEQEIREWAWQGSRERIVAGVEEYVSGWNTNGPSAAAGQAIINFIKRMPVPGPKAEERQ